MVAFKMVHIQVDTKQNSKLLTVSLVPDLWLPLCEGNTEESNTTPKTLEGTWVGTRYPNAYKGNKYIW